MNKRLSNLMLGTAAAALILSATSGNSFAANGATPSGVPPIFMQFLQSHAPVSGLPASDDDLLNNVNAKTRDAVGKLTDDERTKAVSSAQAALRQVLSDPQLQDELAHMPAAKKPEVLHKLWSDVLYGRADVKFNYCNVMLDQEAASIYSEDGVKKLMATPRACPSGVDLTKTLEYVNQTLACAIDDPAYTRILAPEQATDLRQETQGTKQAFDGGGIGLKLAPDPSKTLPLSADEMVKWQAQKTAIEAERAKINPCTGKSFGSEMSAADLQAEKDYKPVKQAFTGLIYHVVKGSPSEKAGLQDGDMITKVDGQPVIGLDSNTVVGNMRGKIGTQVSITVMRGDEEITRSITRAAVLPDNVWSRDLGDGIYAIVIESFERNNTAFSILDEVQRIGPKAKGYVFDVRNNGGGLVDEAVEAVSWFIHDGVIFSQRERIQGDPANPQYRKITWTKVGTHVMRKVVDESTGKVLEDGIMTVSETDDQTGEVHRQFTEMPFFGDKPAVVLANDHSASAAEIFTGGMTENHIAPVKGATGSAAPQGATFIGIHTYGKFIGQTVMGGPLKTAVKATTFRYFSPRGEWLGDAWKVKIGLTADIEVKQPDNAVPYTATDAELNFAKAYLLSGGTAQPQAAPVKP